MLSQQIPHMLGNPQSRRQAGRADASDGDPVVGLLRLDDIVGRIAGRAQARIGGGDGLGAKGGNHAGRLRDQGLQRCPVY